MTTSSQALKFPSPCGDYGSYQLLENISWNIGPGMFPSPCGDYGSYLMVSPLIVFAVTVSVPLRGLWFLSPKLLRTCHRFRRCRFRPLAGIMVLIINEVNHDKVEEIKKFPSPCGDYGSYHSQNRKHRAPSLIRFRPLAGIMVLIASCPLSDYIVLHAVSVPLRGLWFLSCRLMRSMKTTNSTCFRPLAGIMVLIGDDADTMLDIVCGFRPLAGIMVLIPYMTNTERLISSALFPSPCGDYGSYLNIPATFGIPDDLVSVPLRGLWFLSTYFVVERKLFGRFPSPCGDYGSYQVF